MTIDNRKSGAVRWAVILLSLLVAILFSSVSFPEWMRYARPDLVTLVLFYWYLAIPQRLGIGLGWLAGLLLDITHYTLLGQHAIGKALVALVVLSTYQRIRIFPPWQQLLVVFAAASIDIGVVVLIHHFTQGVEFRLEYWQGAVTTALLWPLVYIVLRNLRQRSGMVRR